MTPSRYTDDGGRDEHGAGNDESFEDAALIAPSEASDEEHFETTSRGKWWTYPFRCVGNGVASWTKGPRTPRKWKIRPFFPSVQEAPIKLLHRVCPKRRHKVFVLLVFYACWAGLFSAVLYKSAFASDVPGYGPPRRVNCDDRFW